MSITNGLKQQLEQGRIRSYSQQGLERVRQAESQKFYSGLGYPEYGGKYAPFAVPEGQRVKAIVETDKGLQVTFSDLEAEARQAESTQFFTSLGYPQYGGRYAPFEVPSGLSVHSIRETEKGLQVTFYDPVATSMYLEKGRESREFFTSIGYAKYGGKYAPFDIPEGHRVGEITETSEGLQVTFVDVEAEKQYHAERQRSVDFFQEIGYPQYGGKYDPFTIPKGHQVGEIKEVDSGLQVTFYDTASVEMQRQIMEMENPQIAGISRNYQQYLIQSGLAQQAKYAQPKTVVSTLPKSDYWTYTPSPSRPTYTSLDKALAIIPPAGYRVTNIQPSTVEMVGPLQQGQTRPEIQTVSYSLEPLSQKPITQQSMVEPTLTNFIANPVGVIGTVANLASIGAAKLEQTKGYETFGKFMSYEVSGIGEYVNQMTQAKNFVSPIIGAPSEPLPFTPKSETQEFGMKTARVAEAVTLAAVAPVVGPVVGIGAKAILINEVVGVGISQAFKAYSVLSEIGKIKHENQVFAEAFATGKISVDEYTTATQFQEQRLRGVGSVWLEPKEVLESAAISGVFTVVSAGVFKGVGKVAPTITQSRVGRLSLYSALGAGGGYVLSGGSLEEAGKGALFGVLLGGSAEALPKIVGRIQQRFSPKMGLTEGEQTIGASGQKVRTWVSEPIKELGGKKIRVIGDVTEKPVGTQGVTRSSLIEEYVGKNVPTGHATLQGSEFNLKAGGETVLKGFPEMSKGFRSSQELYHFYSAPGSEEYINIYGGYAGIGKGYSSGPIKIEFGKSASALVTLNTKVSPEFLRLPSESQQAWLSRISSLSGKTGIAAETLIGASQERQLITPAAYERFGVQLPGSKFVSEGKVGTFIIERPPTGLLGKIPIVRTLLTEYTPFTVYKGTYQPVTQQIAPTATVLDLAGYSSYYGRTMSMSSLFSVSPSAFLSSPSMSNVPLVSEVESLVSQKTTQSSSSRFVETESNYGYLQDYDVDKPIISRETPSLFVSQSTASDTSKLSGYSSPLTDKSFQSSIYTEQSKMLGQLETRTYSRPKTQTSRAPPIFNTFSQGKEFQPFRDTPFFGLNRTFKLMQGTRLSLWEFPIADPKQVAKRFNINQRLKKNEIW